MSDLPSPASALRIVAVGVLGLVLGGVLAPGLGDQAAARWGGEAEAWAVGLTLPVQGLWMAGLAWLAAEAHGPPAEVLGLQGGPGRARALGWAALLLPAGLVSTALVEALGRLAPGLGSGSLEALAQVARSPGPAAALLALGVGVAAPVGEELLFRGYVWRALGGLGPRGATLGSAALFGLYHLDPLHAAGAFGMGLVLGWLRWLGGGLWAPLLAHALNNALWLGAARLGMEPAPLSPWGALGLGLALGAVVWARSRRDDAVTS